MDWPIFWALLAQLSIIFVVGLFFATIIRIWWFFMFPDRSNDYTVFFGGNDDH